MSPEDRLAALSLAIAATVLLVVALIVALFG